MYIFFRCKKVFYHQLLHCCCCCSCCCWSSQSGLNLKKRCFLVFFFWTIIYICWFYQSFLLLPPSPFRWLLPLLSRLNLKKRWFFWLKKKHNFLDYNLLILPVVSLFPFLVWHPTSLVSTFVINKWKCMSNYILCLFVFFSSKSYPSRSGRSHLLSSSALRNQGILNELCNKKNQFITQLDYAWKKWVWTYGLDIITRAVDFTWGRWGSTASMIDFAIIAASLNKKKTQIYFLWEDTWFLFFCTYWSSRPQFLAASRLALVSSMSWLRHILKEKEEQFILKEKLKTNNCTHSFWIHGIPSLKRLSFTSAGPNEGMVSSKWYQNDLLHTQACDV